MFVAPMLLQRSENAFNDEEFITELKLDGIRLLLSKFNGKVRLYTRHHKEVTARYPELLDIDIADGTVLDGELIVPDRDGKPDFEAAMERFQSNKSTLRIQYCVFDVIYYAGDKVTNLPLVERKKLLESFLPQSNEIVLVQWMVGHGEEYFNLIQQHDLEGIVLKRANSMYQDNKRSHDWLKVINYKYADVYITGLRKDDFGLLLSTSEGDSLKPSGVMEFINQKEKMKFYARYQDLIIGEDKKFVFIKPEIQCRVKFRNYTKQGLLRIPSFVEYIS
ncbi:ATP-dependent DNA ligase [Neobacillus cucumis]|uniref:ATP-dependent DNA ligase n=1 Tax=Neobacillus cucumis TaxID=1740721 RepID=UPI0019658155|nr:RNA ligase family protein [Neobacillus cucumis]MBM7653002.1 DNA ligase-1 [Neobacillus cucumis]